MIKKLTLLRTIAIVLCALPLAASARAATCGGDFRTFMAAMSREARRPEFRAT